MSAQFITEQSEVQIEQSVEFVVSQESDPFEELVSLPNSVTFLVPSTVDVNVLDAQLAQATQEYVANELARLFGGSTVNAPGVGTWISEDLGPVKEGVVPVTAFIAELNREAKGHIVRLGRYIRDAMRQEAVMMIVNGEGKLLF